MILGETDDAEDHSVLGALREAMDHYEKYMALASDADPAVPAALEDCRERMRTMNGAHGPDYGAEGY